MIKDETLKQLDKPKKKYYKPKNKKEILENFSDILKEKPEVRYNEGEKKIYYDEFNLHKYSGYYFIEDKKRFSLYLKNRPSWFHRTFVKLFFGINWKDQKI